MILLMTLEQHKDGVWVTRLVEELERVLDDANSSVQVVSLDKILHETPVDEILQGAHGIVNRVSDAADPISCKKCMAILSAARLLGLPIFNGPDSYGLATNKWCHHVLFRRAGLESPSSVVVVSSSENDNQQCDIAEFTKLLKVPLPHLVKPNSAGFGAGIVKVNGLGAAETIPSPTDGTLLLQAYVPVSKIYRVWFLLGKVQCAVERSVSVGGGCGDFTTGCAGSNVCSSKNLAPTVVAWSVPAEVCDEVERILALLPDAHAGSVEFLMDNEMNGQRLYFDFNLLSTLPLDGVLSNTEKVLGNDNNPWTDLAVAVRNVITGSM